ncbi:MAG: M56 family metallopeptidase [Planctomycetota bacterium]
MERIGWTLIHFLWQGVVLAAMLAVELVLFRKSRAGIRYIAACVTLALMALVPCAMLFMVPVSEADYELAADISTAPSKLDAGVVEAVGISTPVETKPSPAKDVVPRVLDVSTSYSWRQRAEAVFEPILPYLVSGWLIGVFGLSVWHLGGWTQLQRLRRKMVTPVDASLHGKLKKLAELLGIRRAVQLVESGLVSVPTVVGWVKPVILLPASALTGLSPEQMEAILAHELAHIKRLDYLVNMLQTVVEILGFYHPAVWWVSHKIRVERENCCDDLAVSVSGDRVRYARALTLLEEIRGGQAALAVAASGGSLLGRIRRLVGKASRDNNRSGWVPALVAILLIFVAAVPTTIALSTGGDRRTGVELETSGGEAEVEAARSSQPRFRATFSNGVKVELVGVSEHPSEGKQWWRPDGTLMKDAPYKKVKGKTIDKTNEELNQLREFAVEITGSDSKDISIKYRVPAAGRMSSNLGLSGDGTIGMESIACAFPKLVTAHEVHIGLASGGWQTVASQSADSESRVTRETKAGSITWGVPAGLKNEAMIDVVHPFVEDNVRIVAEDRAGQVVPAHVSRGTGTSMVSAVRLQFPIRLSQVSMFHIQTRPYEWVEFKNVSLKPGVRTDVEVAVMPAGVSSNPAPRALEAKDSEVPKVIGLKYADPEDLSEHLNAVFNEPGSGVGTRPDEMSDLTGRVRFIPDPRSKSILILCSPESMGSIEEMIKEFDRPTPGIKVRKFSATLSDGVKVELVGLYHGEGTKDVVFWEADGSSFSHSETQKYRERVVLPKWGNKDFRFEYGLMMRFSPLDELSAEVFVKQGQRMSYKYPRSDGIAIALVASDPHEREKGFSKVGNVKAAAAYGPWETRKWSARINEPSVLFLDEHSNIMLSPPRRTGERAGGGGYGGYGRSSPRRKADEWLVDVTINAGNIDFDCFYELKDGSIHQAKWRETLGQPSWIGPDQRTPMICKRYALPREPEDGEYIVVKYRRFEIVEFRNVSLKPGLKTDVEVVVGHAAPEIPGPPVKPAVPEVPRVDEKTRKEQIVEKLQNLEIQRNRVQRELDAAEVALRDVRDRWGFADLEERSYPHPVTARLMRLEQQRDNSLVEIAQLKAKIRNLERDRESSDGATELKKTRDDLTVMMSKFEELRRICEEAAAKKKDLDTARVQYKQRTGIRDERKRTLDSLKAEIERLRILHDDPETPEKKIGNRIR